MKLNTKRLREEMLRMDLNQRELANRAGVSVVSINRYVHGERMPKGNILGDIARVLMTTPEYLIGIEGKEHPDLAFARTRLNIRTYADDWTKELKTELINEVLKTM